MNSTVPATQDVMEWAFLFLAVSLRLCAFMNSAEAQKRQCTCADVVHRCSCPHGRLTYCAACLFAQARLHKKNTNRSFPRGTPDELVHRAPTSSRYPTSVSMSNNTFKWIISRISRSSRLCVFVHLNSRSRREKKTKSKHFWVVVVQGGGSTLKPSRNLAQNDKVHNFFQVVVGGWVGATQKI